MHDISIWTYLVILGPFVGGGIATAVLSRLHDDEAEQASEKKFEKARSSASKTVDSHVKRELSRKADGAAPPRSQPTDNFAYHDGYIPEIPQDLNLAEFTGRDASSAA